MKTHISSLFFAFFIGFAQAQTPVANQEVTELINQSFKHYAKFREIDQYGKIAMLRTEFAKAAYKPLISADASYRFAQPTAEAKFALPGGAERILQFTPANNYNLQGTITGILYDFGRTQANIEKAMLEENVGKANTEAAKIQVAYQIANMYYGVVFLKKNIVVQDEQIKNLAENLKLIENKLKNGDALELDRLNTQVQIQNVQNRKADFENLLEKQLNLIKIYSGVENPNVTATDFEKVEAALVTSAAASQNADLLVAQAKIKSAEQDVKVNLKTTMPSINYNAATGFRNGFQPDIHQLKFNYGVGVSINYPFYTGGRAKTMLDISQVNVLANRENAAALEQSIQLEQLQSQADLKTNQQKLATNNIQIEQAQAALKIAQVRFKNGIATNVDVLNAQNNLEMAQLSLVQYAYNTALAKLNIQRLQGVKIW
jgi:outer membrane protein